MIIHNMLGEVGSRIYLFTICGYNLDFGDIYLQYLGTGWIAGYSYSQYIGTGWITGFIVSQLPPPPPRSCSPVSSSQPPQASAPLPPCPPSQYPSPSPFCRAKYVKLLEMGQSLSRPHAPFLLPPHPPTNGEACFKVEKDSSSCSTATFHGPITVTTTKHHLFSPTMLCLLAHYQECVFYWWLGKTSSRVMRWR